MAKKFSILLHRKRRQARVRAKIKGTAHRPRLSVFRSNKHIYAQLIDDAVARTLAAQSDLSLKAPKRSPAKKAVVSFCKAACLPARQARSFSVGETLAKQALAQNIKRVVFDRGGYTYTGRVKALAEGARKSGLKF